MLERGTVITEKDKENFKKNFDRIANINVKLPNGESDEITYSKGENLNYVVSEFCLKHKLTPEYHEKLMKSLLKSFKGR
jgi:hypothetical protein